METKQKLHRLYNALLKVDKVFNETMNREVDVPALNEDQCNTVVKEFISVTKADKETDNGELIDLTGQMISLEMNAPQNDVYIRKPLIIGDAREALKKLYVTLLTK